MGAANIANTEDSTAVINNPAAMFNQDGGMVDIGIGLCFPSPRFENAYNAQNGAPLICALPSFSIMSAKIFDDLKFGAGLFPAGGLATEYRLYNPLYGNQVYESNLAFLKAVAGVAYKINDKLSIGANAGVGYQAMRLSMPYELHDGAMKGAVMGADMQLYGIAPLYSVGVIYKPINDVRLGLVYNGKINVGLDGTASVDATALGAGTGKYDAKTDFSWPQSAGIGVSWKANDKWTFAADTEWFDWSDAFDALNVKFSNGNSSALPSGVTDKFPLEWKDQYVVRLGVENALSKVFHLRAGVSYGNSPVPDSTVIPIFVTITEWSGTLGCSLLLSETVSLDVSYLYSPKSKQSVGTSLVGSEYDGSSSSVSINQIGLALNVKF